MDQIRGHEDVPMTPGGEQEVCLTAWQIGKIGIERVYASDLSRASRSAEIISEENVGYPEIVLTPALRSWDMGPGMEGKVTTPDVIEIIENWVRDDRVVPPGGESFRAYCSRVIDFVGPVFDAAVAHGETVAIMAHGRVVQIIDFWCAAGCDEECMHREFAEYLTEEPDIVPPGGGIHYKYDGLGWIGVVINSRVPSLGTQIAAGSYVRPMNTLAADQFEGPPS
jgi:broad specificity phosphatase PhoE